MKVGVFSSMRRIAMRRITVVTDEFDRWDERAGGSNAARSAAFDPSEVFGGLESRAVPAFPGCGHHVHSGAVAVGLMSALAGSRHAEVVGFEEPHRVGPDPRIHRLRGSTAGPEPIGEGLERLWLKKTGRVVKHCVDAEARFTPAEL